MNTFQFDKCLNSRRVVKACNDEGLVCARRLDWHLNDAEDPELLAAYMSGQNPLITTDRALPGEHSECIPDRNPGIIVVAFSRSIDKSRETLKTMTADAAAKILHKFKQAFPDWHKVSVCDCIIEITDKDIEVLCVENGVLRSELCLDYAKISDWAVQLLSHLDGKSASPKRLPERPASPGDSPG